MKKTHSITLLISSIIIIFLVACNDGEINDGLQVQNNYYHTIEYTSTNGKIITPYKVSEFGADIIDNVYSEDRGILYFDAPISSIGDSTFYKCSRLTSITIPNSANSIGDCAFYYCHNLQSIKIGDGVISIGQDAFGGCINLNEVTMGNSVMSIGYITFENCISLTSITIPPSVSSIGMAAFLDCTNLTEVHISNLSAWCKIDFGLSTANPLCYANNLYLNGNLVTRITIPSDITKIKDSSFIGCACLQSVTIPNNVTTIGVKAFQGCCGLEAFYEKFASKDNRCLIIDGVLNSFAPQGLTKYTIPNDVIAIATSTFYNCENLTSITIPQSVTSIGDRAFIYCSNLAEVYCKPIIPPSIETHLFAGNAPGRKIYVPTESVEAYKVANGWREYAVDIVGYDF